MHDLPANIDDTGLRRLLADLGKDVIGIDHAKNNEQRYVLAVLARAFPEPEYLILCEPVRTDGAAQRSDAVVLGPDIGLNAFEVKRFKFSNVKGRAIGGCWTIDSATGRRDEHPIDQAESAMFRITDLAKRYSKGRARRVPASCWVALPNATQSDQVQHMGMNWKKPPEVLRNDELEPNRLRAHLVAVAKQKGLPNGGCSSSDFESIRLALGDVTRRELPETEARPGTLGASVREFYRAAQARSLDPEQARLAAMDWRGGSRLIRGVAGSGKSIVLAKNVARLLARPETLNLFKPPAGHPVRILVTCFNKGLLPFLKDRIAEEWHRETGSEGFPRGVEIIHANGLYWELAGRGLWKYQKVQQAVAAEAAPSLTISPDQRAEAYLAQLESRLTVDPAVIDRHGYDCIYVDEGQDLFGTELRLLSRLCRQRPPNDPNLFILYDNAQDLYGREEPVWKHLGINIVGRSDVMEKCHRNPRQILEPAFNLLVGTHAIIPGPGLRGFADTYDLKGRQLIVEHEDRHIEVRFCSRQGRWPVYHACSDLDSLMRGVNDRLHTLIEKESVLPHDIAVLVPKEALLDAVRGATNIQTHVVRGKDDLGSKRMTDEGRVTLQTIHSAKGYDWPVVLLAGIDECKPDKRGRATAYVGCTRATVHLDVFGSGGFLGAEFQTSLDRSQRSPVIARPGQTA